MRRTRRLVMAGLMVLVPFGLASCQIPLDGTPCTILILEPGANVGVVCN